ncbi:hypothetical protein GmRootV213_28740 [Variovorax sp. V213]
MGGTASQPIHHPPVPFGKRSAQARRAGGRKDRAGERVHRRRLDYPPLAALAASLALMSPPAKPGTTDPPFRTEKESPMFRALLKSKIHRVAATDCELHNEGSCAIDADLLDAADLAENE